MNADTIRGEEADASSGDRPAPGDVPEWMQGPFPERSRFGTTTGDWYYRCKYCLAEVMTGDWEHISHKPGCKLPEGISDEQLEAER